MSNFFKTFVLSVATLISSFILSLAIIQTRAAWQEPTQPPPGDNRPTPINRGPVTQVKEGALYINNETRAKKFCSFDNPTYCIDPSGTSKIAGNINLSGTGKITGYPSTYVPTNPGDLATKAYVDSKIPPPPTPVGPKRVFITSQTFTGDMNRTIADTLTGIQLANKRCQDAAIATGNSDLVSKTWKAWLSSSTINAKDNINCNNNVSYWNMAGQKIANNCADLLDGNLAAPINVSERGAYTTGLVWTGTDFQGVRTNYNCNDWMNNWTGPTPYNYQGTGGYAYYNITSTLWTEYGIYSCSNPFRIYCFEQ